MKNSDHDSVARYVRTHSSAATAFPRSCEYACSLMRTRRAPWGLRYLAPATVIVAVLSTLALVVR